VAKATPTQTSAAMATVGGGRYCSTAGATGVTSTGVKMVCRAAPTDTKLRWRTPSP
jgi:hypothetical protein